MSILLQQMKWQFQLLYRNNLIFISVAVTAMYAGLFYLLRGLPNSEWILTLLIYNDPAIIGLFFLGLTVLMEKNQEILSALVVSPMNFHTYLLSRIIPLSIIGWGCALGMGIAIFRLDFDLLNFSIGVFSTCLIFCFFGLLLVAKSSEFLLFLLRSIPVLILMSLPLSNYFELTDIQLFKILPIQGPLNLIVHSYGEQLSGINVRLSYAMTLGWVLILYAIVYRYTKPKFGM